MTQAYKLANVFLTAANTMGMQWEHKRKDVLINRLTMWVDKKGNLQNTSISPVPMDEFVRCMDFYEEHEEKGTYK